MNNVEKLGTAAELADVKHLLTGTLLDNPHLENSKDFMQALDIVKKLHKKIYNTTTKSDC